MDGQVEGMGSEKSALHIISLRGVVDQCPFLFGCVWVAVRSLSKFSTPNFLYRSLPFSKRLPFVFRDEPLDDESETEVTEFLCFIRT